MKFLVKDSPFSYDELHQAIFAYINENHGKSPEYAIVHPETRRNIVLSIQDEKDDHIKYTVLTQDVSQKDEEIRTNERIMGLYFLASESVEPGFLIICG
jgi:hypothetical protein